MWRHRGQQSTPAADAPAHGRDTSGSTGRGRLGMGANQRMSAWRNILSWLVFPALVGALAYVPMRVSGADIAGALGLAAQAGEPLVYFAVVATGFTLLALLEHVLPYERSWNRAHGDVRTDVTHLLVTGIGTNELVKATLAGTAVAAAAWLSAQVGGSLWPAHWPLVVQLGLALLTAELGHYWFHRLSHEWPLLWRLHATHHSAPRLYWLNATRFHPLDLFFLISLQTLPLIALGAPARVLFLYAAFTSVYGQIQHCNIDLRTGPFNWLFSTPELHRWHHSTDPREGNANYGAVLNVWDHLFGTFFWPRGRRFAGPVGIAAMPDFPRGYLSQLASPFRWTRLGAGDEVLPGYSKEAPLPPGEVG